MPWITVTTSHNSVEADLLRTVLQGEGIETLILGEHFSRIYPFLNLADGGMKIQVQEKDAERAKELIEVFEKAEKAPTPS